MKYDETASKTLYKNGFFADRRSRIFADGIRLKLFGKDMEVQRDRVFRRDRNRCKIRMARVCQVIPGELDHVLERSQGGTDEQENLRAACVPCHRQRHPHVQWTPKTEVA